MTATYRTEELAELLGVSTWALYEAVRRGEPPVPPIKVGRRIVWPRQAVDRLLGLESSGPGSATSRAANTAPSPTASTTTKDCGDAT